LREGAIAAALTALMILFFLGSWRSTLVVMISIPLAVLSSLIFLYFLGDTLNTMTLGGLALAVGILVDDSTVTIENTHRLLNDEGKPLPEATLHGAAGIAVPTLVSTLAISCVFTSVIFLEGAGKIPVHATRPRGRVRDARLLWVISHPDADHDRVAAQGRAPQH
jgi:multidrug efflux pump subunit AcrB